VRHPRRSGGKTGGIRGEAEAKREVEKSKQEVAEVKRDVEKSKQEVAEAKQREAESQEYIAQLLARLHVLEGQ
jgi:hypothetical protein